MIADPNLGQACAPLIARAREHFAKASAIMDRQPRASVKAPRIMAEAYAPMLDQLQQRGFAAAAYANPGRSHASDLGGRPLRHRLMIKHVHVVGAGLAGLSAAVRLTQAGVAVTLHEATRQAGGRCRSYDDAATGMHIDNGTHLLLSGNHAAIDYLKTIGITPDFAPANFRFVDGKTGESWILRLGDGSLPTWIFDAGSRVPTNLPARLSETPAAHGSAAPTGRCARCWIATANSTAACSIR